MTFRLLRRLLLFIFVGLILVSIGSAAAAANTVSSSRLDDQQFSINLDDIGPPQCAGLPVINLITGSGIIFGTSQSDLLIGDAGDDWILGLNASDCILGGAGDDRIWAGGGNDVCIGGPGTDSFTNCETEIQ